MYPVMNTSGAAIDAAITDAHLKDGHIFYSIKVTSATGATSSLNYRYSDFASLRDDLLKQHVHVKSFPRKHLVRSNSVSVVNERKVELELFLKQTVLCNLEQQHVKGFLQLNSTLQLPTAGNQELSPVHCDPPQTFEVSPLAAMSSAPSSAQVCDATRPQSAAEMIKQSRNTNSTHRSAFKEIEVRSFSTAFAEQPESLQAAHAPQAAPAERSSDMPSHNDLPTGFRRMSTKLENARLASIKDAQSSSADMPLGFRRATVYGTHD